MRMSSLPTILILNPERFLTMNTNHTLNTIEFNGAQLRVIAHEGQRWLTAEQVGNCLGYAEANARQGIINLHNRHADEFKSQDTCEINLISQGQGRSVRIFSPSGCNLLGFFASTPRAKEFRVWAKNVLAGQPAQLEAVAQPGSVPGDSMAALASQMAVIAAHMGKMAAGVDTVLAQMNLTGRYISMLEINQRGHAKVTPEIRDQAQLLSAQGMSYSSIGRLLRISKTTVGFLVKGTYIETARMRESSSPQVADVLAQMVEARKAEIVQRLGR